MAIGHWFRCELKKESEEGLSACNKLLCVI